MRRPDKPSGRSRHQWSRSVPFRRRSCSLPGYKPVSVPLRVAVIHLGLALLPGSSNLPGSPTERTAPSPLFGLAPRGVCPAGRIAPAAVRSYRTFSPLPRERRYIFCGTFREKRFERIPPAVSRHAVLWRPDFPLPLRSDCPPGKPAYIISHWIAPRLVALKLLRPLQTKTKV